MKIKKTVNDLYLTNEIIIAQFSSNVHNYLQLLIKNPNRLNLSGYAHLMKLERITIFESSV